MRHCMYDHVCMNCIATGNVEEAIYQFTSDFLARFDPSGRGGLHPQAAGDWQILCLYWMVLNPRGSDILRPMLMVSEEVLLVLKF